MARLLLLTSRLPYPPHEGHQLRAWHLLRALASRHRVTLLSFVRRDDDLAGAGPLREIVDRLETFAIPTDQSRMALLGAAARGTIGSLPFLAAKYRSGALRRALTKLAHDADLVHFDILPLMAQADCVPPHIPVVFNAHNVEHQLLSVRAGMEPRIAHRLFLRSQISRLRAFEATACRRADLVLACSETDARSLAAMAPDTPVEIVPNGVDLHENRPDYAAATGSDQLVFVGQMGWFPNRDGVEWFLDAVLPRILAQRPRTRFVLVGKPDTLKIPAPLQAHVHVAGFVPDLRPIVSRAAVYIVPLRAGSGTRLKVLEAMALGKAIVTTHVGSEGIQLSDGVSALFADDADSFSAAVISLLESPERAARLGQAARACAEAHYGWDAIGRGMLERYDQLIAGTGHEG